MRHFLGALYRKDTLAFKEELRTAEVLIIDESAAHLPLHRHGFGISYTVNAFADLRRRVVIAADRTPHALEGLGADVKSRLAGGLCIVLDKPDRDTRLAIVRARAAEFCRHKPEVVLPEVVLERIADLDDASPRELIGVFHQAGHLCRSDKKAGDPGDRGRSGGPALQPRRQNLDRGHSRKTAEFYKLGSRTFHSPQRARRVARPANRHVPVPQAVPLASCPRSRFWRRGWSAGPPLSSAVSRVTGFLSDRH